MTKNHLDSRRFVDDPTLLPENALQKNPKASILNSWRKSFKSREGTTKSIHCAVDDPVLKYDFGGTTQWLNPFMAEKDTTKLIGNYAIFRNKEEPKKQIEYDKTEIHDYTTTFYWGTIIATGLLGLGYWLFQ